MKFTMYYRTSPGANKTNAREGEFNSMEDARAMALKAIKAKYPDGVLLNVVESSQAVELVDLDRVFSFYYRKDTRGEVSIGRAVGDSKDEAAKEATKAVKTAYPAGSVLKVFLAKNSPTLAKNAHGVECAPSLVY